jgi:hypothetical protein
MDDDSFRLIVRQVVGKLYELHLGFTALFNLCDKAGVFSQESFAVERERLEKLPDFRNLREALEKLDNPMGPEAFEEWLRTYRGPIQ